MLFSAGDHVPVIPFSDVVGNAVNVPPEHIGATALKVGVTFALTVTSICALPLSHNETVCDT